jgi:hypothetical protein
VTDLPYLEPLVIYLKKDPSLRSFFNESDFFAEPKIDPEELEDQIKKNGKLSKYFWIFPGETIAKEQNPRFECASIGIHTFFATIIKPCTREQYFFIKDAQDGSLKLSGEVIELTEIRKAVKDSISKAYKIINPNQSKYGFIYWKKDEMINLEDGLLIATSIYEVQIN